MQKAQLEPIPEQQQGLLDQNNTVPAVGRAEAYEETYPKVTAATVSKPKLLAKTNSVSVTAADNSDRNRDC